MREEGPSSCEMCGGQLRRVIHPTGIIFKGSGFYSTDARRPVKHAASKRDSESGTGPGPSGSETGASAESKTTGAQADSKVTGDSADSKATGGSTS
jgi:hypothetical protein